MIKGKLVQLRPASLPDRRAVYGWMAQSDITPNMMGPPTFPETPPPSWEEFLDDYARNYFEGSATDQGRSFIIEKEGEAVGHINYNALEGNGSRVELDIWMAGLKYTGKGYGPDAIESLTQFIHHRLGCTEFIMAPSARNPGAIKAYEKAGFVALTKKPKGFAADYDDAVVMVRNISP